MKINQNGFLYKKENKEVITEIFIGNNIAVPEIVGIFYGTKTDAIEFGLIFNEE